MRSKTLEQMYDNLKRKGIKTERGNIQYLNSYSYYQTINAYKALFISDVLDINKIEDDIKNNGNTDKYIYIFNLNYLTVKSTESVFDSVCKRICSRYQEYSSKMTTVAMKKLITEKNYLLHIYNPRTKYSDFIRMYQFEHSMRNLLLKYVLRIEEDIKNIFIQTLTNKTYDSSFLLDINNYDMSNDESVESIIKLFKKQNNKKSNPIGRKINQKIIPPFWILINELTMGELKYIIKSLKPEYQNDIVDNILSHFTSCTINNPKTRLAMLNIIDDISNFRNDLAHNNPIYLYNVYGKSLYNYPNIEYFKPVIKNYASKKASEVIIETNNKKAQIQNDLRLFFGSDSYNSKSISSFNIDLSYVMYIIYNIIIKINSNSDISIQVFHLYTKYGIFNLGKWGYTSKLSTYEENKKKLKEVYLKLDQISSINYKSQTKVTDCKSIIKDMKKTTSSIKKEIKEIIDNDVIIPEKILFDTFSFEKSYTKYTGIDINFLYNIFK